MLAAKSDVQVDTSEVRVTEWRLAPGSATGHHTHGMDYVIVPVTSGRREFRIRTGMFFATAGRMVLGWSTFAPKYASSAASANESLGTRRGCAITRWSRCGRTTPRATGSRSR